MWPFFLWAVFVIIVNAIEYVLLEQMSSSISLLNIVNFILIRHHLAFFYSQVCVRFTRAFIFRFKYIILDRIVCPPLTSEYTSCVSPRDL